MSELNKKGKTEILLESFKKNELKEFNKFINYSLSGKTKPVLELWNTLYNNQANTIDFGIRKINFPEMLCRILTSK